MEHEGFIRLSCFVVVFALVAYAETRAPRRALSVAKKERWFNNLGIITLGSVLVKVAFPIAATGVAAAAEAKGWGLFNQLQWPLWWRVIVAILILDLVIYLQHLMFHAVPLLWRFHMIHHADLDLDVTSGLRFHPIEIVISMLIKMTVVAGLGIPVVAVLLFEITLNATAMFNHGNLYLPHAVDRVLRWLTITPDMHRVHHSVLIRETNSNFGFNFPWWDRLFGTYRAQPVAGHTGMTIGIAPFRTTKQVGLLRLLILPFGKKVGRYSLKYIGADPAVAQKND